MQFFKNYKIHRVTIVTAILKTSAELYVKTVMKR